MLELVSVSFATRQFEFLSFEMMFVVSSFIDSHMVIKKFNIWWSKAIRWSFRSQLITFIHVWLHHAMHFKGKFSNFSWRWWWWCTKCSFSIHPTMIYVFMFPSFGPSSSCISLTCSSFNRLRIILQEGGGSKLDFDAIFFRFLQHWIKVSFRSLTKHLKTF